MSQTGGESKVVVTVRRFGHSGVTLSDRDPDVVWKITSSDCLCISLSNQISEGVKGQFQFFSNSGFATPRKLLLR